MPARTTAANRRVPRSFSFPRWFFPERKVARVFFVVTIGVHSFTGARDIAREIDLREFAVFRERIYAVVDRLVGSICVTACEQSLDQFDHFGDVTRSARNYFGTFATECVEVFP